VITWTSLDEAIDFVRNRPKPLALYLFTGKRIVEKRVLENCSFGGGCINDTVIHLATSHMGFGGVGIRAWAVTTANTASIPSPTIAASYENRPGWIYHSGISIYGEKAQVNPTIFEVNYEICL